MQSGRKISWWAVAMLAGAGTAAILLLTPASKAQTIPSDAAPSDTTCNIQSSEFAQWFQSHSATLNGVVNPADSIGFSAIPNCPFYKWSQQMFMWLTSPTPPEYGGGGGRIFDAPKFFDVSPVDATGHRSLIAHSAGPIRIFGVRVAQLGAHGLPVAFSKTGRMLEVETAPIGSNGKPLVMTRAGLTIEIDKITRGPNGKAVFLNKAGKTLLGARPFLQTRIAPGPVAIANQNRGSLIVQKFVFGNRPIFVDPENNIVEVEQGEAGTADVLETQNKSLVYYGIHVNDVYAYFLTGISEGKINASHFPTSNADLLPITTFASSHGVTFPDPNALAIEVKTAWVEASSLADSSGYVTRLAAIPTYDNNDCDPALNPTLCKPTGQKTVLLALVGMHVVGSTNQHPEMIWATFEHFGNTPNDTYKYVATGNQVKTVSRDTSGSWLFSKSNSNGPFNKPHMSVDPSTGNIQAKTGFTIGPSDTLRSKAWGGAIDQAPNPINESNNASSENSNSEIIAINSSVRQPGLMPAGDVRGNYILTGATWTVPGGPPDGSGSFFSGGDEVGTSKMANTTLETYDQGDNTAATGSNCFSCHSGNMLGTAGGFGLSHVFGQLQPLTFPHLLVMVKRLSTPPVGQHRIEVTVTNSATGAPVSGATVTVTDLDTGLRKTSGVTSGSGTVTLQYIGCREVIDPGDLPKPVGGPRSFPVPCDGNVTAAQFSAVEFSAP